MAEFAKPLLDPDRIVKELFSGEGIARKTELSVSQVEAVSKILLLSVAFNSPVLRQHLQDFMELQLSKDRKSKAEFVEALKSKRDEIFNKAKSLAMFG